MTFEQRHKCMSHIRSKDTKPELALRKALRSIGLIGYRKNYDRLPGTPDIAFTRYRLAIFVDGDFWHGRDWETERPKRLAGRNPDYWVPKIEANIARDLRVNTALRESGWTVLRFWGSDVMRDAGRYADIVRDTLLK